MPQKNHQSETPHFTRADLREVKCQWRVNFNDLWRAYKKKDILQHDYYCKIEKELDKIEIALAKELGIYANDPCVLRGVISCGYCTGWFVYKRDRTNGDKKGNIMCQATEPNAHKCTYKKDAPHTFPQRRWRNGMRVAEKKEEVFT